jgi:hypothetical protein
MKPAAHFYHCWADGEWVPAADEHITALASSGFRADRVFVGLVGGAIARERAHQYLEAGLSQFGPVSFIHAIEGYEQVTLTALRDWCRAHNDPSAAVLYAHTKGAYNVTAVTIEHRRIMTGKVAGHWRHALDTLNGHDTAGCFWEPANPHYVGNFWWARTDYLADLPAPPVANRHQAETWIAVGDPTACELNPEFTYAQLVETIIGRAEDPRVTGIRGLQGTSGLEPPPPAHRGVTGYVTEIPFR